MTYLYAIAGTTEGLNVVTELIMGYALPGRPEALMFVKSFGYNINGQADSYISDQKMGLYAKVPPRAMYRGQLISAVITSFVGYGVVQFVDNDISGICTPGQSAKFNCENGSQIYFSASVVWGAIGPKRIFSQIYPALQYSFLLGFLLALVWWTVKRFGAYGREWLRARLPAAIFNPFNTVLFTPISWLRVSTASYILLLLENCKAPKENRLTLYRTFIHHFSLTECFGGRQRTLPTSLPVYTSRSLLCFTCVDTRLLGGRSTTTFLLLLSMVVSPSVV